MPPPQRSRARRPTRFADGTSAWDEREELPPLEDEPEQEHEEFPAEPTADGPRRERSEASGSQWYRMFSDSMDKMLKTQQDFMERQFQQQQSFLAHQNQQQQQQYQQQQSQQQQQYQQWQQWWQWQQSQQSQQQAQQAQQFQPASQRRERPVTLAEFKKFAPEPFRGVEGPLTAEAWLMELEKVFRAIKCADSDKVIFASFLLQGDAEVWWKSEVAQRGTEAPLEIWEDFKVVFLDNYFPPGIRRQKVDEFNRLQQGSLSVSQYIHRFDELSRYVPSMISADRDKAAKFESGLRQSIRREVSNFELFSYRAVVNKALVVEKGQMESRMERDRVLGKRPAPVGVPRPDFWGSAPVAGAVKRSVLPAPVGGQRRLVPLATASEWRRPAPPMSGSDQGGAPRCGKCGGPHFTSACSQPERSCFRCGQQGHLAFSCPQKPPQSQPAPPPPRVAPGQRPRTQGRVFALTQQDAQASNSVVTGTIYYL